MGGTGRRFERHFAALTLTAASLLTAWSARAADIAVALDWASTPGCMSLDDERVALQALTGRAVEADVAGATFTVRVRFERAGGGWAAWVNLARADGALLGERELHASSAECHALDDPLTLAVGLLIDLEVERQQVARRQAEAAASPSPPPPAAHVEPPVALPHSFRVPPEPPAWSLSARATTSELLGLLPEPATAAGLAVEVTPPRWGPSITASATVLPPRDSHVSSSGMTMGAWYVTAGLCPVHAAGSRLLWNACAAFATGVLSAGGLDLQTVRTASPTLVGAQATSSLRLRVAGPVFAGLSAGVLVPFGEHHFFAVVDGSQVDLHTTWPAIPMLGVELGVEAGPNP